MNDEASDAETVVEGHPPTASVPSQHTVATTVVMRSEELDRARAFYKLTAIMTAAAAAFMPFVPGPLALRAIAMALCTLVVVTNLVTLRRLRDETRYTPRYVALMGVLLGVVGELVFFYMGLFTAAVMVLPLGVYFFGLSESRFAARTTFFTGAIVYAFLSIGVVAGFLPDLGPMPIGALPVAWKCFFVVMVQVVFATTYFLARSSRRATETAIARVERANRQIFQKEAQLAEARIDLDRALRPGEGRYTDQIIDGWRLGDVLGRGGMGEVYRATRGEGDAVERAAIKLLHPIILSDPSHVKRFAREAELARKVASPYVARVIGTGNGPAGVPYVAMELLTGRDLAWHLRQTPRMKLSAVTELVTHGARALAAIREAGIVHRDLKPQNLVLEESTTPHAWKVLDFGVSRLEASGHTLTQGALVGTPAYMAPEQARLDAVDHRADVYSLAAVAYRALTGKPPFAGREIATVLYQVVHEAPARPTAFAHVHEDVELVLAIGLAKSPDERFQRAEDLADAFERAARGDLDGGIRARGRALVASRPWSLPRENDAS
jgi:serine/threonine-protein kinase